MGLEMVADDDYVCTGIVGSVHRLGRTDSPSDNKGDGGACPHGTDNLRRDRTECSRTRFEIDGLFAHQFSGDTSIDDGLKV